MSQQSIVPIAKTIQQNLYKQVGLYRQLLEWVRKEHQALIEAQIKGVQECVSQKEALIHQIQSSENERLQYTQMLAAEWKVPVAACTLFEIIKNFQPLDPKLAEQLQSTSNALKVLVDRVVHQNRDNGLLIEQSMLHIENMKRNVLGEPIQKSETYTAQGYRNPSQPQSRFLAQEG